MGIPALKEQGNKRILMVDGQPFVMLAGEVHNSDSSSPEYMEGIWDVAESLGMNALLLPVSWEMIEPEEGKYDFSVTEQLIRQARERGKKIGILWFGSWKNAECMYAPAWVKQDLIRFPRAQIEKGKNKAGRPVSEKMPIRVPYTSLSYLGQETMRADARAFAELMRFLKEFDGEAHTVLTVQVENETGLLGAARERSEEADRLFTGPVPPDFAAWMRSHTETMVPDVRENVEHGREAGSWTDVFGTVAEEIFSAYHVAGYVNYVAEAGKKEYPLPMCANCWLDKGGKPGSYPTGGPVSRVHEVWQFRAPSIDLLTPDIYIPQFSEVCEEFTRRGGALYIPETATHSYAAPRMLYTVGHHHAVCYAPFGFDDMGKPFTAIQGFLFGMDVSDPALKTPQNAEEYGTLGKYLRAMLPMIGSCLGTENLNAVSGEQGNEATMTMGNLRIAVRFQSQLQPRNDGCLLAVRTGDNECWILGNACSFSLHSADAGKENLDLLKTDEMVLDQKGELRPRRRFNGDETASLSFTAPTALRIRYFLYR